jgi:hypothetical protein
MYECKLEKKHFSNECSLLWLKHYSPTLDGINGSVRKNVAEKRIHGVHLSGLHFAGQQNLKSLNQQFCSMLEGLKDRRMTTNWEKPLWRLAKTFIT